MSNEEGSGCARCGSTDGALYKCAHVSIHADEVVRLCRSCFEHVLDRQRLAVKENAGVLQSVSGSPVENTKLEVNWWMMVGGAIVMVAVIAFFVVQMFGAFAASQGPTGGPYFPGYGPPPNSSPYFP